MGFKRGNPGCPCCSSSGGHTVAGCPCTAIPDTIYLHVASPPSGDNLVFPAAIAWQTKPSDLSRYTSDPTGYYSDEFTSSSGNYKFRYWFGCSQGQYFVSGLFTPDSPLGYPGRFLVMQWLVGLSGNTCTPFSLTNGSTANTSFRAAGISVDGTGPA